MCPQISRNANRILSKHDINKIVYEIIIIKYLYYFKIAKEMNVTCDFLEHNLTCVLPENTMDMLLKVRTRSGEHTLREDIYTRTLKYRRWKNKPRPFHSLKKRTAWVFRKKELIFRQQ